MTTTIIIVLAILMAAPVVAAIASGTPLSTLPSGGQRRKHEETPDEPYVKTLNINVDTYQQNLDAMRAQFDKNVRPQIKDLPEEKQKKIQEVFEMLLQQLAHL